METKIIIAHDSVEALKASPLWAAIMAVAFEDGPVSVTDIELIETQNHSARIATIKNTQLVLGASR